VGRWRDRLSPLFWDEIRILAAGPQAGTSPADAFLPEDAADLTTGHLDAVLAGHGRERSKRPFELALRVIDMQLTARFIGRLPWWGSVNQVQNGTAFLLGEPWLAPTTWFHAKTVESALIKRLQAFSYGLRMAAHYRSNLTGTQPIPTVRDDLGMEDPVGWAMDTPRQFPDFPFLSGV
jgi:hypothetical protein